MQKVAICILGAVLLQGCLSPEAQLEREQAAHFRARAMDPILNFGIHTSKDGVLQHDSLRIKKGRKSFFNRYANSPDWKFVTREIDDHSYQEFKRLALTVLRVPRGKELTNDLNIDGAITLLISADLFGEDLELHGLEKTRCMFPYIPGEEPDVDELYGIATSLLAKYIPQNQEAGDAE